MFKRTGQLLIRYVGSTKLTDLPLEWQMVVNDVLETVEKENPRIETAEIKGHPHKSSDDRDDPEDVVSVRLKDGKDTRIASIHIHQDGTSKQKNRL